MNKFWWGWIELNYLPSGYEPPALTDELQPRTSYYTMYFNLLGYIRAELPLRRSEKLASNLFSCLLGV